MLSVEEMNKKIADLEQRKQQLMAEANANVGFCEGQIALLKELIAAEATKEVSKEK